MRKTQKNSAANSVAPTPGVPAPSVPTPKRDTPEPGASGAPAWESIEPTVHAWIDQHEPLLVSLVKKLVSYPSVAVEDEAKETGKGAALPFGKDCAALADATQDIVEGLGLTWENHSYYAISASYGEHSAPASSDAGTRRSNAIASGDSKAGHDDSSASSEPRPRIAFYSHLDVVPASDEGWASPPFQPEVRNGWIFGRGSTDNKGPFTSVLLALKFLADQGIKLRHDVTLFGCFDEEGSMDDVKWLLRNRPLPQINLVSDCSFPVCAAEKGIVQVVASIRLDDPGLISLKAGEAHNVVPAHASALVASQGKYASYQATGTPAHAAFPKGSVNALGKLTESLSRDANLKPESRETFGFVRDICAEHDGRALGVAAHDDFLGSTTAVAVLASYEEGTLKLVLNVRYPAVAEESWVLQRLSHAFGAQGFTLEVESASKAHFIDPAHDRVKLLTRIVNEELGTSLEPYAMGGATHARLIPGAIGFGPGRFRTDPLPAGVGGGHQVNEGVKISHLKQAIAIYIRAILALDQEEQ